MAHSQRRFFQRFIDFGTGRLPANMTLHGGRYLLLQTLGKGGMGAVYLARDTQRSNELVAIKEMSQGRLKDPGELQRAQQRFQQEADMLRRLRHRHLPQVYHSFQDNKRSYLVMDYIRGKTLADILKQARGAALPIEQVVNYGLQLCDVLTYLHTYTPPIIFRDLKPSNILVQDDGQLFLIDFGIARFWQQTPDTETFVTPGYASPEQYGGQSAPRSDIFSLGATLHYCLTGHNPQAHTQTHQWNFLPVDFFNAQAPRELCTLVEQMVQIRPEDRPANAREVQNRLSKVGVTLVNAVRLPGNEIYDPAGITYQVSTPPKAAKPPHSLKQRLRVPLAGLGMVGSGLLGGVAVAFQGISSVSVGSSLRAFPARWWKSIVRAVDHWSWDPRVWTPRFIGVLLSMLALILGGSLYLFKTAPDAPHLTALVLIFGLLCLLAMNLRDERLTDPVLRSILGLMGGGLLVAGLALQALPDMVALEQHYLPLVTLNQVGALLLVLGATVCLLRPAKRLAWVDHLQLGGLAGSCALLYYSLSPAEIAQFPFLPLTTAQQALPIVIGSLAGLALLAMFRYSQPFTRWSSITLLGVALVFAPLQYTVAYQELPSFLPSSTLSAGLTLGWATVFCVYVPPVCALLASLTRRPMTTPPREYHPGIITRLALFLLTLVVAALFSQQGQAINVPLFTTTFSLSSTILTFTTLYQLLQPLLVLLVFIAFLRLRQTRAFTWLDHAVMVSLATICALFDSAYWQVQAVPSLTTAGQQAANQQFLVLTAQLPADAIYGLLIALPLGWIALAMCHFRQQSRPSARLDAWLKGLRTLLRLSERLLVIALVGIALILQGFFGPAQGAIIRWVQAQQFTGNATDIMAAFIIGMLLLLALLLFVIFARLLASSRLEMGRIERWSVWLAALACLVLIWQDQQRISSLPLLATSIQLTGNVWNAPAALLNLIFVAGLFLVIALHHLWLRRGFFTRYRTLMQQGLWVALLCFLLQLIWPIFLPWGLIIVTVGVLLASQIEKAV